MMFLYAKSDFLHYLCIRDQQEKERCPVGNDSQQAGNDKQSENESDCAVVDSLHHGSYLEHPDVLYRCVDGGDAGC